jgi:LuxR family maltose regulon positive regulatory protein
VSPRTTDATAGVTVARRSRRTRPVVVPDTVGAARYAVPPLPRGVIRRARLQKRLDAGLRVPLTLVTAPAGTGKTVLVSSWVPRLEASSTVVWLSLDDATIGPTTFWQLVVSGLSRRGVDVPADVSPGPDPEDLSFTASIAGRILAHQEPVVLVLDCDGTLPVDVASGLDTLIRRSGDRLRVVLLTREDPLLPLHRYRLAGRLVELRLADLAFTPDEGRQMLVRMGVDVSATAMDAIITRTQGWAAGLRMAAMSLLHRVDREEATLRLAGDTGTVAEYLLAEVLDTQPDGVRRLLLDTSVVDIIRPGLAATLAGPHAERALSFLVHGNAFIEELPDLPGCYRYHHLFRELLRAQLAYEAPARSVELHRVAATWLAEHGRVVDAVRHAIAVRDWEAAARFAVDDLSIAVLLATRPPDALTETLAKIPKSADGTAISVVTAARAVAAGDRRLAESCIRRAHRHLADPNGEFWPAGELAVQVLTLVNARRNGDAVTALDAAAATEVLIPVQDPRRMAEHPEFEALVHANRGAALVLSGRLDESADALAAAAATRQVAGREEALIDTLGQAALLAAWRGDLRRAGDLAARAIRVGSGAELTPRPCPGAAEVALAYVHTERYDLAGGRDHAARAARCEPGPDEPLPATMLALTRARLCRAVGDIERALSVLDQPITRLPDWLADRLALEKVSLLVAAGEPARALDVAQQLSDPGSRESGRLVAGGVTGSTAVEAPARSLRDPATASSATVDSLLESAVRYLRGGSRQRAVRTLDQALRLAAPELSRRAFRAAPDDLRRLLEQQEGLAARHAWLVDDRAYQPSGPQGVVVPRPREGQGQLSGPSTQAMLEPLTEKEREVLGHLSELLTTDEIATVMFISVNTVRTHVRNILRKLAASRRNEAVRRARDLKIISD